MTFALDTSGTVTIPSGPYAGVWTWETVPSDFVRGHVEALFADKPCEDCPPADYPTDKTRCAPCLRKKGFSDLHPEALELILRDCDTAPKPLTDAPEVHRAAGAAWFSDHSELGAPFLSDEGKVCLRPSTLSEEIEA